MEVEAEQDIFQHGHVLKQRGQLKGAHQAAVDDVMRFKPVISSPPKRMVPAVGGKKPLNRLKQVVLPAPFGPMRPTISPSSTCRSTLAHCGQTTKMFRQILRLQKGHTVLALYIWVGYAAGLGLAAAAVLHRHRLTSLSRQGDEATG